MEEIAKKERPSHCTCGTRLVEDALFCHRCGRPVFEPVRHREEHDLDQPEPAPEPPPQSTTHVAPPPPVYNGPPEPIDLRNRSAVRLAFFAAALQFPLILLPAPVLLKSVLLAGGGFFAAWLYQRRTQSNLGALNGFRLGWISGLLLFLLVLSFYAITFAIISFSGGNLFSLLIEGMEASGAATLPEEQLTVLREVFADWTKLFVFMLIALFVLFLYFTALAGLGGALASRFPGNRNPR